MAVIFISDSTLKWKNVANIECWVIAATAALQCEENQNTKILFSRCTRKALEIGSGSDWGLEMPERGVCGRG